MHKKGQAEVWEITLLFELLAGFVIAGILLLAVISLNDTSLLGERYAQRDLELLRFTLHQLPGKTDVSYPLRGFRYENGTLKSLGTPLLRTTDTLSLSSERGVLSGPR